MQDVRNKVGRQINWDISGSKSGRISCYNGGKMQLSKNETYVIQIRRTGFRGEAQSWLCSMKVVPSEHAGNCKQMQKSHVHKRRESIAYWMKNG